MPHLKDLVDRAKAARDLRDTLVAEGCSTRAEEWADVVMELDEADRDLADFMVAQEAERPHAPAARVGAIHAPTARCQGCRLAECGASDDAAEGDGDETVHPKGLRRVTVRG